jgi:hypothetical protein
MNNVFICYTNTLNVQNMYQYAADAADRTSAPEAYCSIVWAEESKQPNVILQKESQ